ncbi:tRNA (32-2'-O)-methyltransferase regulator THADA-like [Oculina patagonica]
MSSCVYFQGGDTLKCALLYFLSRMVSVVHGMTSNKDSTIASESLQALKDFSNITLETSSPTESVELRLCTAQILGHSSLTDLMVDLQETLNGVHLLLWSVVITLLQDEEAVVREQTVEAFSVLLKGTQNSTLVCALAFEEFAVVAPLSLESAMFCVWFLFIEREPVECVFWMLKWIWNDMLCSYDQGQEDGISDADRLFEKGPLNIYAEDLIMVDVAWKTVKQGIEMNNGNTLLMLQKHQTELTELLNQQLKKCVVFLENLLLTNWIFNRNLFIPFYKAFAGISLIAMLTGKLKERNFPLQTRIMAILQAVKEPSHTGGISLHPKIQCYLNELCKILTL